MKSHKTIERLLTVIVILLIFNLAKDWDIVPRLHANSDKNANYAFPAEKDTSYVIIVGMSEGLKFPVSLDEPVGIYSPRGREIPVQLTDPVEVKGQVQVTNVLDSRGRYAGHPLQVFVEGQ